MSALQGGPLLVRELWAACGVQDTAAFARLLRDAERSALIVWDGYRWGVRGGAR